MNMRRSVSSRLLHQARVAGQRRVCRAASHVNCRQGEYRLLPVLVVGEEVDPGPRSLRHQPPVVHHRLGGGGQHRRLVLARGISGGRRDLQSQDAVRVADEHDDLVVAAPGDVEAVGGDHAVSGFEPGPLCGRVIHDGAGIVRTFSSVTSLSEAVLPR